MKLLISGSRSIKNIDISPYIPEGVDVIISGGAIGIDALAEKYADQHGIKKIILLPDYNKYGRVAPLVRDEEMVNMADCVLAIWDGVSRGTKYTMDYAKRKNKKVILHIV